MFLCHAEILELEVHLFFLRLHGIALRALVRGILAHETHTTIHLRQVVGAEDEHQLALSGAITMHVAHRLDVVALTLVKLSLEHLELRNQLLYLDIEVGDVVLDGVKGTTLAFYLGIDNQQVLQTLLDGLLVFAQSALLFLDLLLDLLSLVLQGLYGGLLGIRALLDGSAGLGGLTCLCSLLLGHSSLLRPGLVCALLLRIGSQGKGQQQENNT